MDRTIALLAVVASLTSGISAFSESDMIVKDFVRDYASAKVSNTLSSSSSQSECSGKIEIPGIFLHPVDKGDAVVSYPAFPLPTLKDGELLFLVFRFGFRDDIPWKGGEIIPNGCQFSALIDGKQVFAEDFAGVGWQARAVPIDPTSKPMAVELHVNAIDGHTNYDWAMWGAPMLVRMPAKPSGGSGVGLTLVQVAATEATQATVRVGETVVERRVDTGTTWIPFFMPIGTAVPSVQSDTNKAALKSWTARSYPARLVRVEADFSSPLLVAGEPFSYFITEKNEGPGDIESPIAKRLQVGTTILGIPDGAEATCERLANGQSHTFRWDGTVTTGAVVTRNGGNGTIDGGRLIHVFDPAPATSPEHDSIAYARVTPDAPVAAVVGNAWSRLSFIVETTGDAYAIAETWTGTKWQRTGSLYPLASLRADGHRFKVEFFNSPESALPAYPILIAGMEVRGTSLVMRGRFGLERSEDLPVLSTVTFTPDPSDARIQIRAECALERDIDLFAFYGPTVLAGDRAYGSKKDFAIFPGLEYLEGDEASSSERDLAFPLSDRRVPAPYKIATPLMAVQAQDSLMALLWDAHQEWIPGERTPAARFSAPAFGGPQQQITMALFAPSVGKYLNENSYHALPDSFRNPSRPVPERLLLRKGQAITLTSVLVLDHKSRYDAASIVNGPHKGGLVLMAMQHWFDVYGLPDPSKQPRDWDVERALCRDAYLRAVWNEKGNGWAHCAGWKPCGAVAPIVSLTLDLAAGMSERDRAEVQQRIDLVTADTLKTKGKHYFWSNAGAHILFGELPFYMGYLSESLADLKRNGAAQLAGRKDGLWTWNPSTEQQATLGDAGGHTLAQASHPSYVALRAARLTGDPELAAKALDAMKQMERYEVPRGAQTWECPLYQPDILASAQAIRAYCEAYRLTGDKSHLDHARYWAWTGLPFLYMWELDGYPTMRYNAISVLGSTFYKHSWLGLPVVWCGLVYAYALQDLAEFDQSFDWKRIAQGINNSAMWQQYPDGTSKGCYPDSWSMVKNTPNPADINPENILVNEFRLRGHSPEIRNARLEREGQTVMFNTAANIVEATLDAGKGRFVLRIPEKLAPYAYLAQVSEPKSVKGAGDRAKDSDALRAIATGWMYDPALKAVVVKCPEGKGQDTTASFDIRW